MTNNQIRLNNGETIVLDEYVHWPVYSTIEFQQRTKVDLLAFLYTEGTTVPKNGTLASRTSTLSDTNMNAKGRTNQDEALVVFAITPEIFGISAGSVNPQVDAGVAPVAAPTPFVSSHNMRILQTELLVEFYVGAKITKPQVRAPLGLLPSSVEVHLHSTVNYGNANVLDIGHNGPPSACSQWRYELPVMVESDRLIKLRTFSPKALLGLNQNIRIRWILDTLKRRPFG